MLWWLADNDELSPSARSAISDPEALIYVSAASAWEIAIKRALGKLKAPENLAQALEAEGFRELPITVIDASSAGGLPSHHQDPFDRMLIAQAKSNGLHIVTRDPTFSMYEVDVVFA